MKQKMNIPSSTELRKEAEERRSYLIQCKKLLDVSLSTSPPGKIHVAKHGNRIQFYLQDESAKTEKYISKNKTKIINTYLQKAYNEKAVKFMEKEIHVLEKFIRKYGDESENIKKLYSGLPEEVKLSVSPVDVSDEDYVKIWQAMPYVPKKLPEEAVRYITDRGEHVRSKSELLIANTLNKLDIPYRYECPLELRKGLVIYPDFTVLNPRNRKEYYWEHRGMMDDRDYAKHSVARIKDYGKSGIVLGQKLIITEETSADPLGSDEIMRVIETFFQ